MTDARTVGDRIESLLAGQQSGADRESAEELVRLLVEMYGAGLGRIVAALCAAPVSPEHGHVVDTEHRSLKCACRACYLLFTRPDAGRFRAVPDRCLHDPRRPLTTAEWEGLGIPFGAVFFLRGTGGLTAFYPSPAGATECLLNLDVWARLEAAHPLLAVAEPDVEAILIHSTPEAVACFLVPIDVCYELVGLVRVYWKGFDGGQEAHEQIDAFFARIRARAAVFEG